MVLLRRVAPPDVLLACIRWEPDQCIAWANSLVGARVGDLASDDRRQIPRAVSSECVIVDISYHHMTLTSHDDAADWLLVVSAALSFPDEQPTEQPDDQTNN